MNKIRWGIIGCGDVTEVKSGPAFQKVPKSELVAVMRRDAGKAADYARRHGVPSWYSNADQLINDPNVDAVYIATPPNTHAFYAIKAINAGKPVYIEKPMCRTYAECLEVNKLAHQMGVKVFVAYYRRKLPGFLKVKELIGTGKVGEVRMVTLQLWKHQTILPGTEMPWRVNPDIAGGGFFYDLASHQFDYLEFLFGSVTTVKSIVKNQSGTYKAEDLLTASFEFENGVVGTGSWCFNSTKINDRDTFEIIGTKGRIEFSTFDFSPVKLLTSEGIEIFDFPKPEHVQQYLIEEIVTDLLGKGKTVSNGETGARTNFLLEEIVKEYYKPENNKIITI
jgi:predicted dehydrogenase